MFSNMLVRAALLSAVVALVLDAGCAAGHLMMLGDHHDTGNAPVARIAASVLSGPTPLNVDFDFGSSYCPGGYHTAHHVFDPGLGTRYTVDDGMHYMYTTPGTYHAKLWIEDAYGNMSSTEVVITAL